MIRPLFLSLLEQRNLLLSGKISSYELTKEYIEHIQKLNGHLNIIIRKNFRSALQKAQELDKHLKVTGQPIGPLHGVPFTTKDAFRVKHFGTSYGFPGFNLLPAFDSCTVVERLLEAGGVFLGQTNVPLACFDWQTNSPVYGLTRNLLDDTRTVGGSSGGSAASVAAFFSPFEIGADVAGSIRYPAHCCGVFGLRPTHGFVPFSDTGPFFHKDSFHNLVVAGPLARSIDDLKLVLSVITATEDNAKYKQKLRIAYTMHWSDIFVNQESDKTISLFIEQVKQLGHELVEITPEIDFNYCTEIWGIILGYEFKQLLPAVFRFKPFVAVFNFFFNTKRFHTGIFKDSFQKGLFANQNSYREALDSAAKLREKFLHTIRNFDLWLTPVAAREAIPIQETGTWQLLNSERIPYATCLGNFLVPTALFHHPVIAAPIGSIPLGFPISVQLHGKPGQDWQLLSDCARLEELFAVGSRCELAE